MSSLKRASFIVSHLTHDADPRHDCSSASLHSVFLEIERQFALPLPKLLQIRDNILNEMRNGLQPNNNSTLKMIPTFVTSLPTGKEKGISYAIDIGGSNLRILRVVLDGEGNTISSEEDSILAEIPKQIQESDAQSLFGFVADCIAKLVRENNSYLHFGFTFSFPLDQKSINSGHLIKWTKGFSASGIVGKDVVELLNHALKTKGINATVNALINDTTGTMLAGCYQQVSQDCCIGLILGTGTNACYWEKIENIKKFRPNSDTSNSKGMIINMEGGNFGSTPAPIGRDLPITRWDEILDKESLNPNHQMFEKQISGMYLGEIVRLILVDMIYQGKIFTNFRNKKLRLQEKYGFPTKEMSEIEIDQSTDLLNIKQILENYGITLSSWEERQFVKKITHLVSSRAAALASSQLAACIKQMSKDTREVVVAVDGSVFEKYPGFKEMMETNLEIILQHKKVRLVLAKDGSGVGAALASFIIPKY